MERELWPLLYHLLQDTAKDFHQKNVRFQPWILAAVLLWAALHDRPLSWACQEDHWSTTRLRPVQLPSPATLSRHLYTVGTGLFLHALEQRIRDSGEPRLVAFLDGKPLPVGGASQDPDAKRGRGASGMAKGYKLHAVWSDRPIPEAWEVTPLNVRELVVAERLLEQLSGGGYLFDGGSGLRTRLSIGSATARQCRQGTPLPESASVAESRLAGRGLWPGVVRDARLHRTFVRQCDLVRCGAGTVTGVGETTTSGSYLGVGETLDRRCPDREKTRTYAINAKGSPATGFSACRWRSGLVGKQPLTRDFTQAQPCARSQKLHQSS